MKGNENKQNMMATLFSLSTFSFHLLVPRSFRKCRLHDSRSVDVIKVFQSPFLYINKPFLLLCQVQLEQAQFLFFDPYYFENVSVAFHFKTI